jgi:hypothetical protein
MVDLFKAVIEWLHKQLNEESLQRPLAGNFSNAKIDFRKYAQSPEVN